MTDPVKEAVEDLFVGPDYSYKRYLTLGLAVLTGLVAASVIAYLTLPQASAMEKNLPPQEAKGVRDAALYEVCSAFFFFLYMSGMAYARLLRAGKLAREIHRNSEWHLAILHAMSLLTVASTWWRTSRTGSRELRDLGLIAFAVAQAIVTLAFLIGAIRRRHREA